MGADPVDVLVVPGLGDERLKRYARLGYGQIGCHGDSPFLLKFGLRGCPGCLWRRDEPQLLRHAELVDHGPVAVFEP